MHKKDLKSLSDDELLARLLQVLKDSRRCDSMLIAHIAEVDARRLYAREACPSMHKYCTDVLHLSDAEAYFRITAARAARRYPVLLTMLEDGRIHLSGIEVLAPHLDGLERAERDAVLARATHKTKREILELVAEISPKPDVPSTFRKLPERRKETLPTTVEPYATTTARGTSKEPTTPSGESSRRPPSEPVAKTRDERRSKERLEPLSPARYKVQFTASAELREKIERLSALMPGEDLASVIDKAVSEKLERLEAKRYGKVKNPRKSVEDANTAAGVREIPAPVKRVVWKRDGGQCTFRSADGRRCPERHRLEFHHDDPYGFGGDRSPDNICLMCKPHNLYMAEKDYGRDVIDHYRGSADRAREPGPTWELSPERVDVAASRTVACSP